MAISPWLDNGGSTSEIAFMAAAEQAWRAGYGAEDLGLLIDGATGYAIYMLDSDGHVTIWNKGAERIKGWSGEEVIGKHHSLFLPPEEVAAGRAETDLIRAQELGRLDEERWRVRKDGSEFLAHVTITPLIDGHGVLRGFGGVVRDVTEETATDQAIQAREQHLQSILATVPDAMIIIDEQGRITSFSAAAEQLFGYSEGELLGKNVSCLMPSPDRERHDDYIGHYLATGERRIIGIGRIVVGQRHDGTTFPMQLSIGEAGEKGRRVFTGFIRDLTERERDELRMKELQSELVHVSRLSAMGTMASTLAHELNQPLTAVANYLETTRDLLADPDPEMVAMVREALDDAAKESLRAGHIVRRLRDFVARGEVEKRIEDLPRMIEEASALALIGASERGVRAFFQLGPAATPVLVDRVQIQQVLVNLIRNAVEAMEDSLVRDLTIATVAQANGLIRVSVGDTGSGIAEDVAPQLFEAFVSNKSEGMGLGLSICRTIIEAHGGRIWTEPAPANGAIFHFTLLQARPGEEHES
jgi:two-component system sensor kinase FixL